MEAARLAHDARLKAVRVLAEARQKVVDVRESSARDGEAAKAKAAADVNAAELDDVKAWDAALRAGWQAAELRRIGFAEAEKKARVRRRRANGATTKPVPVEDGKPEVQVAATGGNDVLDPEVEPSSPALPDLVGARHD